ncbi:excinuclease ABC subunit C [Hasllibacter halocynthiae]|uniref:UvrABC system protein C n=1 Tax=Hasllibacter halocynthiae TaxID=595589 RepID=A0A2T0X3Q5_9RHOB|nr:excinuclease ABC subunit UvrC [Hasllibacter halocynthiae]PRY93586.1 excinuclease ABC subunit C [Hasllibacter halocynthiae]
MNQLNPDMPKPATGPEVIKRHLRQIDGSPGVYRMLDAESRVLYVGKAKNLKARVSSYARLSGHSPRIRRMICETASMMFLTTRTETEALLLEQNLIKQLKPKFNVLLRDDKSFPNIMFTADHDFPRIAKHRGRKAPGGQYFGPFASAGAVNRVLTQLQKVFLLRNCSDAMFDSRSRPCLLYQIKRCSGPCVGLVSEEEYAESVRDAARFLQGKTTKVQENLAHQMEEAAEAMEFERAAALRDRIKALTMVQSVQGVNPKSTPEADVIALHTAGGQACVQVFFIRAGQNWGNRDYYPKVSGEEDPAEVMEAFVGQFYENREAPSLLLVSHGLEDTALMEKALGEKAGRKVRIGVPQKGEKAELVAFALRNARESLTRRMSEGAAQAKLLEGLAEAFGLPETPRRIEVYDNSHIMGADAVGAFVVVGPDGYEKGQYRKFNIKGDGITAGDDFGMMTEVLTRRFTRLLKEDPDREGQGWPDLLLIDGGAGQVSAVAKVLREMGVDDVPVVGVAKGVDRDAGKEVFHVPGRPSFALRRQDPVLYFVQRMRDEAHRFAIGTHRAKRSKGFMANPLDDVPGVGQGRKSALLRHFGSAKAVSRANLKDLQAVPGISKSLAQKIYDHFQAG